MKTCFICLDESDTIPMKQLCERCISSTICIKCETDAIRDTNPDILTMCPFCRQFLGYKHLKIRLISVWHPITLGFWFWRGVGIPFWQQVMMTSLSYNTISGVTKETNKSRDNGRPSTLNKLWMILNSSVHIPYLLYHWWRGATSDDQLMNTYLLSHFLGPVVTLIVGKIIFQIVSRNNS